MPKFEDDVRQALSEEATFDRERAQKVKEEAAKMFGAKLARVERVTWAYLAGCAALGVFAGVRFFSGAATKELIIYGVLFLLAIETQVLIKLWYWIMNSKLGVLKELKQMRLEAGEPSSQPPPPAAEETDESAARLSAAAPGLSTWERRAWLIGIIVIAGTIGFAAERPSRLLKPVMTGERYVTLAENGNGSVLTKMSFCHEDMVPMTTFRFHAPGPVPSSADVRLFDERGRELPVRFEPTESGHWSVWAFSEPVMPGETSSLKMTGSAAARKEGSVWVYESDWSWGYRSNLYRETVMLPAGAQIVSVTPEPEMRFRCADSPGVRFREQRGPNETFRYTIKYRLPAAHSLHGQEPGG